MEITVTPMEPLTNLSNTESILIVGRDGYIRQVIALQSLGYVPSEIIGLPLSYFIAPQDLEALMTEWRNYHQQPNTSLELSTTIIHRNSQPLPVYVKFTPLGDRDEFLLIVRNYHEQMRQRERLQIVNDIAIAISQLDVEQIMAVLYERISELMETKYFFIGLYDDRTGRLTLREVHDGGEHLPDYKIVLGQRPSITQWIIEHRQKLVVQDISKDSLPVDSDSYGVKTQSGVFIPLVVYDQVVGVMSVQSQHTNAFSDDDIAMLEALASPTALAIYNARLFDNLQRQLHQVKALHQLAERITIAEHPALINQAVVETLTNIFEAHFSFIALYDNDNITITSTPLTDAEYHINSTHPIINSLLQLNTIRAFNREDFAGEDFFHSDTQSLMAAPLISGQTHLGVLVVCSVWPSFFTAEHLQLIEIVATQTAAILENWRLLSNARNSAEELSAAYNELQALDQLRQELVDNVSHELRSPLSYVRAYVGLMSVGELGNISREQGEALKLIDRKTDNMLRLINDILEVEKIRPETLQLNVENIHQIVQQVYQSAKIAYMTRNVELILRCAEKNIELSVDALRIEQVLQNLISNAVKFSPSGGKVLIECIAGPDAIEISVSDEGEGIPADKLKRIFERFYRVPGIKQDGIGIGLSIVKQIVEAHGGQIAVESAVSAGTTFSVFLPR